MLTSSTVFWIKLAVIGAAVVGISAWLIARDYRMIKKGEQREAIKWQKPLDRVSQENRYKEKIIRRGVNSRRRRLRKDQGVIVEQGVNERLYIYRSEKVDGKVSLDTLKTLEGIR